MNTRTDSVQILRDNSGNPTFAVLPFADFQNLIKGRSAPAAEPGIPLAVVDAALNHEWSAARAWREHKALTQADVAQRMGVTQGAYAQLEAKPSIRKSSRIKIADALGIHEAQLDF